MILFPYLSVNKIVFSSNNVTLSYIPSNVSTIVDKLADLDNWLKNVNGDKTKVLTQYYYIKSLDENSELIYILTKTQIDTVFKCSKRVTKEIE